MESGFARADAELAAAPQPEAAASAPLDPATSVTFRGRCVESPGGAPLADVRVELRGSNFRSAQMGAPAQYPWTDPPIIETAADGTFELMVPEAPRHEFDLTILHSDRCMRTAHWDPGLPAGEVLDLGEIVMPPGHRIAGRIVDQFGQPAAKLKFYLNGLDAPLHPAMHASDVVRTQSAEDGSFAFEGGIPPGVYGLRCGYQGWRFLEPREFEVSAAPPGEVIIRIHREATVEGFVVDADGTPVEGASLTPRLKVKGYPNSAWSKADGSFKICEDVDGSEILALELSGDAIEPQTWNSPVSWGTRDLRIQVERSQTVALTVVERESGAPVEEFSVRTSRDAGQEIHAQLRLPGPHPGGTAALTGMRRGRNHLLVVPKDPQLVPRRGLLVDVGRGAPEPLRVEVERAGGLQVLVALKDGTPVPGSRVLLLDTRDRYGMWLDPRDGERSISGELGASMVYSQAESDSSGLVQLFAPRNARTIHFTAEGAHNPAELAVASPFEQPSPILLTVTRGGSIRGRLIHPEVDGGMYSVSLRWQVVNAQGSHSGGSFAHQGGVGKADFAFEGLEPGDYELRLAQSTGSEVRNKGAYGSWMACGEPLAQFTLAEGEDRVVDLDASAWTTGSLEARVILEGQPAGRRRAVVIRDSPDKRSSRVFYGGAYTDEAGRFALDHVLTGTYHATLLMDGADGNPVELASTNAIEIVSGQRAAGDFHFRWRRVRIQILAEETGEPLLGWRCHTSHRELVTRVQDERQPTFVTNQDGIIELEDAPLGTFAIWCYQERIRRVCESVELGEVLSPELIVLRAALRP